MSHDNHDNHDKLIDPDKLDALNDLDALNNYPDGFSLLATYILVENENHLKAVLQSMSAQYHDISDVLQITFLKLRDAISKGVSIDNNQAYLITIAKNAYRDLLKKKQKWVNSDSDLIETSSLNNPSCSSINSLILNSSTSNQELLQEIYFYLSRYTEHAQLRAFFLGYNFKQNSSIADLFFHSGIATKEEIAKLINMPLPDLLSIWERLPLEASEVVLLLGIKVKPSLYTDLTDTDKKQLQNKINYMHRDVLSFIRENVKNVTFD